MPCRKQIVALSDAKQFSVWLLLCTSLWTCISFSWSTCEQPAQRGCHLCVRVRSRTLNSCHLFFLGIQANVLGASLSSTGPGRTALPRAFVSRPLGTHGLGFGVIFFLRRTCRNVIACPLKEKRSLPAPALCSLLAFLKRNRAMGLRGNYSHK